ncbi:hypothetical protein Tco_0681538 [Tanacetum coccineum]|uniref:Uncharacterized protein n=1 Tax=Tanacetum coccineum TaxID=301880 RepID=A0ABQ4XNX6_9ASTR
MHNNIMAAGSKDRLPMLGPGRYSQWRSRFLRYIDTKSRCVDDATTSKEMWERLKRVQQGESIDTYKMKDSISSGIWGSFTSRDGESMGAYTLGTKTSKIECTIYMQSYYPRPSAIPDKGGQEIAKPVTSSLSHVSEESGQFGNQRRLTVAGAWERRQSGISATNWDTVLYLQCIWTLCQECRKPRRVGLKIRVINKDEVDDVLNKLNKVFHFQAEHVIG